MNEGTFRRRAATECPRSRLAACKLALVALVVATVVMAAGVVNAPPAQGETSPRYQRLWDGLSDRSKRWARRTSRCESGGERDIHGGGGAYHGAFQFSLSTWRHAPKSPGGDAHRYSRRTQSVVAVYLKKRDGARTHWPSCG